MGFLFVTFFYVTKPFAIGWFADHSKLSTSIFKADQPVASLVRVFMVSDGAVMELSYIMNGIFTCTNQSATLPGTVYSKTHVRQPQTFSQIMYKNN